MSHLIVPEIIINNQEFFISDSKYQENELVNSLNLPVINRRLLSPYDEAFKYLIYPIEIPLFVASPVSYIIMGCQCASVYSNQILIKTCCWWNSDVQISSPSRYVNFFIPSVTWSFEFESDKTFIARDLAIILSII